MKRFLKNNMFLLLSLALVFALVGSTYAYLVATDSQIINSFRFAKVDTHINEKTGNYGMKEVTIENDDISSVYVRARVLVSAGDVGAEFGGVVGDSEPRYDNKVYVQYNSGDWYYDEASGWFYYLHVLPGTSEGNTPPTTQPLIHKVIVGTQVTPEENSSFEVDVYEESVLTSNTSANVDAATVMAAFAKPTA